MTRNNYTVLHKATRSQLNQIIAKKLKVGGDFEVARLTTKKRCCPNDSNFVCSIIQMILNMIGCPEDSSPTSETLFYDDAM
ncbi:hypothetical protein RRG08_060425 [Elysia crispata]|uniref:Uncharacterized protein n=1 Tax=Elysia crispata TaxID=231223 RepID=A0AAE1E0U3_9GAST|nr:hypothetical protein RRG08_060425 [Elysia crispata]